MTEQSPILQSPTSQGGRDPTHQTALPVLDTSVFEDLLQSLSGELGVVLSIYRTFLANAVSLIGALPHQDAGMQASTLHTLKGSASIVGASRLADLAARLHERIANDVQSAPKAHVEALASELLTFRTTLSAHTEPLEYSRHPATSP